MKIKINGHRIRPSKVVKYLGVYIDENLNWDHHKNFVSNKLKRANGALIKLRHYVPDKTLTSLYFSLFHSHLSYAAQIWGQHENIQSRRILSLQKQAFRIISFSDFRAPSSPLFLRYKVLSFLDFVKYLNIIFIYKHLNKILPLPVLDTFILNRLNESNRSHRSKPGLLKLPEVRTVTFGNQH